MLLVSALLFVTLLSGACSEDVHQVFSGNVYAVVNTTYGSVRGQLVNSNVPNGGQYYIFKGIPYAKPPVGDLRFKAPVAHPAWSGVRDALQFGSTCVQQENPGTGAEDCLFVSVFTPQLPGHGVTLKPVMVNIHGGGFTHGSGNTSPDRMLQEGIVFVSLNYRLSVLGFLSVDSTVVSSNNGLKDQSLALRWVHANIARFGGDPAQVTIFGQSAGGASIEFQMLSPLSRGLFHRAISDSGSALNPWAFLNSTADRAFALGKRLGHTTTDATSLVKFLKSVSAQNLEKSVDPYNPFPPTLEYQHQQGSEVFLPEEPIMLLRQGRYTQVPYITGCNNKEQKEDPYVLQFISKPELWKNVDMQRFIPDDLHLTRNSKLSEEIATEMKKFYLGTGTPSAAEISSLVDVDSDQKFVTGIHRSIKQRLAHGNSHLYVYEFSYDGLLSPSKGKSPIKGAAHADDIGYLFYIYQKVSGVTESSTDAKVSQRMVKMWTNFVKYGNPTQGMTPAWLPSTKASPAHLSIDAETRLVREDLAARRMAFWDKIYASMHKV
ncbi:juvenile hormone esterase-like [Bacillus rossius redtenbacheri]|uniref:juvenile hormone esterase-like n=1 Tax=Bacillus rossius redtenbacheri TaxID=93214 RepID=UPI002FDE13C2